MPTTRTALKGYFNTGDRPTEQNFAELIDNTVHLTEDKSTTAEVQAGTNDSKFVTPAGAKASVLQFVPIASATVKGVVELATVAEVQAGTDAVRAVTPAGAKAAVLEFAPVKTINSVAPVSGNVTLTIPPYENVAWAAGTGFATGISSYDATSTVRYKRKNGVVFLDGKIKGGAAQTNGLAYLLFILPAGFRPITKMSFAVIKADTTTTSSVGRIDIDPNGNVFGVLYSIIWTSIAGISFVVD